MEGSSSLAMGMETYSEDEDAKTSCDEFGGSVDMPEMQTCDGHCGRVLLVKDLSVG